MNGEKNEASKINCASNANVKADTYNFLVNRNFPENEMPKSESSTSINSKVIYEPSDNLTVALEANNEGLHHKMVGNEVSKCDKAQDVSFKITEESNNGRVVMDHFTAVSEDNITNRAEVNENCLLTNKSNHMTLDEEINMNLDFLNETEEDFVVNFDQLINMVEDCYANTSTTLDTNKDSKKNCDMESYLAADESHSFITF
ncbi:PREDICTED: uncharacterized protein LOC108968526 [Bactrocera latifrons]|uniref:uncharacterized protein LOC108968526 n=1 Tax=Bactrocera latifrons TaxID=174628 RepID=UPI0008DDF48E|nr:PREDICTED: uncharacterized protein LOC108968526 [Bactrocera latifrons]